MAGGKQRPNRRQAILRIRVRDDTGWSDLTICNISERGMMLRAGRVPVRGAIIEIRAGTTLVIGEVRWSAAGRCGVRSQEPIDVEALLTGGQPKCQTDGPRLIERPAQVRTVDPRAALERSRVLGRLIDHGLTVALVLIGVGVLTMLVSDVLSMPFQRLAAGMAGQA
jgi:hypothetical protein